MVVSILYPEIFILLPPEYVNTLHEKCKGSNEIFSSICILVFVGGGKLYTCVIYIFVTVNIFIYIRRSCESVFALLCVSL